MIHETTDYDQFSSITSNREVDFKHVRKLAKAISEKNLLAVNPIICNDQLQVIDGQHRLEAAKSLGYPIFYVMNNRVKKSDIAAINSLAKNWSVMDYINYWTIEKRPGFDKLSAFLSEHPLIPPSTALLMLSGFQKRDMEALRNGYVNVDNYAQACVIADVLKFYRNMVGFAYDRNFVLAICDCLNTPGYNHDTMKAKLEYQSRSLVKCINKKQYVEMLEEIYNKNSSKNKISIG